MTCSVPPLKTSPPSHDAAFQIVPANFWRRIVEPAAPLSEPVLRRARLLAWLIVGMMPLVAGSLVLVYLVNPPGDPRRECYTLLIVALGFGLTAAWGVNRTGRYHLAAALTVVCGLAGPWGSLALDREVLQGDIVPLMYVAVPVMLCSILLSAWATVALAAVQIGALCLLPVFEPRLAAVNWASFIVFVLFVSVLSVVANVIRRRDLERIDRRTGRLHERQARLREQSVRDPLTGLFNRRYLEEALDRELRHARLRNAPLGIIMLDIDSFKQFNDTHGHAAGDELLRKVGQLLRGQSRHTDIACRFGGEEFTLILPGAPLEALRRRAEELRQEARRLPIQFDGRTLSGVTLSLGVAVFPENGQTGDELLRAGDEALYAAKRAGRDRVVVAS